MSGTDSFIEEVTEEVRRERLSAWLRRWGWVVALGLLLVVGLAAWIEWRQAQARATAELRGEVLLTALEEPDPQARVDALMELPPRGEANVVGNLLLGAERLAQAEADPAIGGDLSFAAWSHLYQVAEDESLAPLYRDLAMLKAMMIAVRDGEDQAEDIARLEGLAAPGAPFRLLARETIATAHLLAGDQEAALAALDAVVEDADVPPGQRARVEALRTALGAPPVAEPAEAQGEGTVPLGGE